MQVRERAAMRESVLEEARMERMRIVARRGAAKRCVTRDIQLKKCSKDIFTLDLLLPKSKYDIYSAYSIFHKKKVYLFPMIDQDAES